MEKKSFNKLFVNSVLPAKFIISIQEFFNAYGGKLNIGDILKQNITRGNVPRDAKMGVGGGGLNPCLLRKCSEKKNFLPNQICFLSKV